MSGNNQKKNTNATEELKVQSKYPSSALKRALAISSALPQPPVKNAKVQNAKVQNAKVQNAKVQNAKVQNAKVQPPKQIGNANKNPTQRKVYVAPSAFGINYEADEIDVVAVEPVRRAVFSVKVLPVKSQIQSAPKVPNLQTQMQYKMPNLTKVPTSVLTPPQAATSSLVMANRKKASTFLNFDALRQRTSFGFERRDIGPPTDHSLHLLSIASYDYLKEIIEQLTGVAKSRIAAASDKRQQALLKEERKKIEFLNDLEGVMETHEREAVENAKKNDEKDAEKKRLHQEKQIINTNETALAAIGGRYCPAMSKTKLRNMKPNIVTQVQMKDCLFFMENNSTFSKSALLYECALKYS